MKIGANSEQDSEPGSFEFREYKFPRWFFVFFYWEVPTENSLKQF